MHDDTPGQPDIPTFGQQIVVLGPTGWRAWVLPIIGGLAFAASALVVLANR